MPQTGSIVGVIDKMESSRTSASVISRQRASSSPQRCLGDPRLARRQIPNVCRDEQIEADAWDRVAERVDERTPRAKTMKTDVPDRMKCPRDSDWRLRRLTYSRPARVATICARLARFG